MRTSNPVCYTDLLGGVDPLTLDNTPSSDPKADSLYQGTSFINRSLVLLPRISIADDCHLLSDASRRPLRFHSNDIRKLLVPRTHNKLGDRSFSTVGPRLWNDLPPGLRRPGLSFDSFRRSLKKTHLFGD